MQRTVFISLSFEELESLITESLNKALEKKENASQSNSDRLLNIQEAAAFLHLEVQTIYGLVSKREIPHCKKSKRLYFSEKQLTEWVLISKVKTKKEIQNEIQIPLKRKK